MSVVCSHVFIERTHNHNIQETNPFSYIEINGLKLPEPSAAYALLWEAVSGHDSTIDGKYLLLPTYGELTVTLNQDG
jgi:Cdc6-like AAA superfamily ATPase